MERHNDIMERHNDKQERLRPFGGKWGDVYVQSDRAESESRESESSVICQDKNK